MTLQTASFRARPSVMVAALSTLNSSPHAAIADPKAIDAGKPPRDLTDTHKALDLEGYPSAVCVLVPKLSPDEMAAALKILMGSTNGRYVDDATAKKLLADKKACGTGETSAKRFNIDTGGNSYGLGKGVSISHHHEPRRIAGTPINRGEHVAVH